MKYYFSRTLDCSFEEVMARTRESLAKESMGVISEINITEALKNKLGVDFRKYWILGACSPPHAFRALQAEDKIGTMLPCNIIIQDLGDGKTEVAAVDPIASMMAIRNNALGEVAIEVQAKLQNVIKNL
jgi:uncharacterized protein (DUF302 family)